MQDNLSVASYFFLPIFQFQKHRCFFLYSFPRCCLSSRNQESKEFTSDQVHWNRLPEETVVHLGLDGLKSSTNRRWVTGSRDHVVAKNGYAKWAISRLRGFSTVAMAS